MMTIKKELKRTRMIHYFVDAAADIIGEEGIDGITIRKVADRAGYNSATLYNYFENLDHLIFLAAFRFLQPYTRQVGDYTKSAENALERNLLIWDLFCQQSFQHADIYEAIFFARLNSPFADYMDEYCQLYPEDLPEREGQLSDMITSPDIYDRNHIILMDCVKEGFFHSEDLTEMTEMTVLIYKGMLSRFLEQRTEDNETALAKEYQRRTMKYIRICYDGYRLK